jgi:uncharacterized membrane protein YkoI
MARQRLRETTVNRGTSFTINYQHQHDGVDVDLLGATVYFTMKADEYDTSTDDSTALVTKTLTEVSSPAITDALLGNTNITLTATDTYQTPGSYYWDIKVKEDDGNSYKTAEGIIVIDGSATNRNL